MSEGRGVSHVEDGWQCWQGKQNVYITKGFLTHSACPCCLKRGKISCEFYPAKIKAGKGHYIQRRLRVLTCFHMRVHIGNKCKKRRRPYDLYSHLSLMIGVDWR